MTILPLSVASPVVTRVPPPIWTYLAADLRTGVVLEELPLTGVRWGKRLNDAGAMSGRWQLGPAEHRDAYALTTPTKTALFAVRDSVPQWGGIVWTRAYDSESEAVSIQAGDFWSYFDHRKVVPFLSTFPGDTGFVAKQAVTFTAVEQNEIARQLVTLAQAHTGGDIGIELDTTISGTLRDRTYSGYELTDVGEALRLLANVEGGPDVMFDVGQGTGGRPRRVLRVGDPMLGQQGSPHVWEVGGNVLTYTWPSDGTRMATRTYGVGDGIEEAALVAFAENFDLYGQGWPLLEAETGYTTVTDPSTLNAHARADLAAATLPVVLPALKVRGDMPPFLGQFGVGDDGRLIIAAGDRFHRGGLDARMRVVQMDVEPETSEGEQVTLTMSPLVEGVF